MINQFLTILSGNIISREPSGCMKFGRDENMSSDFFDCLMKKMYNNQYIKYLPQKGLKNNIPFMSNSCRNQYRQLQAMERKQKDWSRY